MSNNPKNVTSVIEVDKSKQDDEEVFWEGLAKISDEDISKTNRQITDLILRFPACF